MKKSVFIVFLDYGMDEAPKMKVFSTQEKAERYMDLVEEENPGVYEDMWIEIFPVY